MGLRIALTLAFAVGITACGSSHRSSSSSGPSTPQPTPTPTSSTRPTAYRLFETNLSSTDLENARTRFLANTPIQEEAPGRPFFNINTHRGTNFDPNSPVIHTYHRVYATAPLAVRLPSQFIYNIPNVIQEEILRHDLDRLDILFTPQLEARDGAQADDNVSLKAAFWMFPDRPPIDTIADSPENLRGNMLMGLYDSDFAIQRHVQMNRLTEFETYYHHGLLSPNTGHINMDVVPADTSFAMYSLVIFPAQRRAAVTLHWSLNRNDKDELLRFVTDIPHTPFVTNSFESLLYALNASRNFAGTSLMAKLNQLTRIR